MAVININNPKLLIEIHPPNEINVHDRTLWFEPLVARFDGDEDIREAPWTVVAWVERDGCKGLENFCTQNMIIPIPGPLNSFYIYINRMELRD